MEKEDVNKLKLTTNKIYKKNENIKRLYFTMEINRRH